MKRAASSSARRAGTRRPSPSRRPLSTPAVSLASEDWTVLALVLVERLSLTEAACALELSPAEVRRRYDRALARLRRAVAPWTTVSRETSSPVRRAS